MDTVLILHTHAIYRSGIKLLLLYEMDINVLEAGSGKEALRLLREYEVHLVIMDSWLPDMEKCEMMRQITGIRPTLPVILLSSDHCQQPELLPMDHTLSTRSTRQDFTRTVLTILNKRHKN
jgi:DNA-binding NarL/FixJ family response regulator